MKKVSFVLFFMIIVIGLIGLVIRGDAGTSLRFQYDKDTSVLGPFESSNNNSRYALTESIVEKNSFFLSESLAQFSAPDLVYYKGKFFSIFTPGVSFVGIPFYVLGKVFGVPQLFTYLSTSLISVANLLLIVVLSQSIGAALPAAFLAGFIYLFGTHALPYAVTFTQHQMTVLLVLLALMAIRGKGSVLKALTVGVVYGFGVLVDIPNIFIILPMVFAALTQYILVEKKESGSVLRLKLAGICFIVGLLPFLSLFGWYNESLTGSYTKLGQFIGRSNYPPDPAALAKRPEKDLSVGSLPFNSRLQLNGLYILLVSNERGWFYFSPIIIIGLLGLGLAYKSLLQRRWAVTALGVIVINIILYSMFGDPWGGWSFGPRYLMPATAVASIGLGLAVSRYGKNIFFFIVFAVLIFYSVRISLLGVLTTNSVPPKQEAEHLITPIPYTYRYNETFLEKDQTSSLFYNLRLKGFVPAFTYYWSVVTVIVLVIAVLYALTVVVMLKQKGSA